MNKKVMICLWVRFSYTEGQVIALNISRVPLVLYLILKSHDRSGLFQTQPSHCDKRKRFRLWFQIEL